MVDKRIKKSQEKVLRADAHKYIDDNLSKLSLSESLKKIYSGDLSKEVASALKTTYPTKRVEISKISVMNPDSLMEVPPEDSELEKILEDAENDTPAEKTVETPAKEDKAEETESEETAKIMSTNKKDNLPDKNSGCSISSSNTG